MKIKINEKESYVIEIPEEIDVESFSGLFLRLSNLHKFIVGNKNPMNIVNKDVMGNSSGRKRESNRGGIFQFDKKTAKKFVKQWKKSNKKQKHQIFLGLKVSEKRVVYDGVRYLINKYNIKV